MIRTTLLPVLLAAGFLSACAMSPTETATPALSPVNVALKTAVEAPHRSAANKARDVYRHPEQTLEFFGIRSNMTVVEIWPGGGWCTEILAPYLRDRGTYVAAGFVVDVPDAPAYYQRSVGKFNEMLLASPALYDRVVGTSIGKPGRFAPVAAGTADAVLTFRNVHNWMGGGFEKEMFAGFFAALKPGGVLGVVEHRANADATLDEMKKSGYVTEDLVIQLATEAGFKLDAKSEINANPRDTKNYAEGVWTLPPSLRLKEQDQAKYLAIGESDRMTLRFVKP